MQLLSKAVQLKVKYSSQATIRFSPIRYKTPKLANHYKCHLRVTANRVGLFAFVQVSSDLLF